MTTPKWFIVNSEDILHLKQVSRALYREDYLDGNQQRNLAQMISRVVKNIEQLEMPEPEVKKEKLLDTRADLVKAFKEWEKNALTKETYLWQNIEAVGDHDPRCKLLLILRDVIEQLEMPEPEAKP